jgi:3-oxoacyl-[acyl-carrier-protein] synthase II
MLPRRTEAWITGIGLVSSLGEGIETHWQRLGPHTVPAVVVDEVRYAPYPVHPLVAIDVRGQIPKTSDQRQMGRWQRIGVYAAGLALADAGVLGEPTLLNRIDLAIAAGNGERDLALDGRILGTSSTREPSKGRLNQMLMAGLRPTLYLGQLSNLLAGNVSIIHKATGSSRTFKGEEMAGVAAMEDALGRLGAGQSELMLVGGALNAERDDLLLNLELGGALLKGSYRPVWSRREVGGGMVPGSVGAFLVIETPAHAMARDVRPYASLAAVAADRSPRRPSDAAAAAHTLMESLRPLISGSRRLDILSGASGLERATYEEREFLNEMVPPECDRVVRAYGSVLGHGMEAHFITGVALAALALSKRTFYPPFEATEAEGMPEPACGQVLVTSFGHWCGEALGLVEPVAEGGRG